MARQEGRFTLEVLASFNTVAMNSVTVFKKVCFYFYNECDLKSVEIIYEWFMV